MLLTLLILCFSLWGFGADAYYNLAGFWKARSAPVYVQSYSGYVGTSTASVTAAFPSNTTAHNLIIVGCASPNNRLTGVTDTNGNTYAHAVTLLNGTNTDNLYYAANIAGGTTTVSCNYSPNDSGVNMWIAEIKGALTSNVLDSTNSGTGSGSAVSLTVTTTHMNDLIVGLFDQNANFTFTAGSGLTLMGPGKAFISGSKSTPGTATLNGTWSGSPTWWGGVTASFRAN